MYKYILNYDKDTTRKEPEYQTVYDWLEKQHKYKKITESVFYFESNKTANELDDELSELFFKKDTVSLVYLRKKEKDGVYQKKDDDTSYLYHRSIEGTK